MHLDLCRACRREFDRNRWWAAMKLWFLFGLLDNRLRSEPSYCCCLIPIYIYDQPCMGPSMVYLHGRTLSAIPVSLS